MLPEITKMISDIEDRHTWTHDAMQQSQPPQTTQSFKDFCFISHGDKTRYLLTFSLRDTYPTLLSFTHCGNKSILRVLRIILVILPEHPSETIIFHNEDGNPARDNIKQALGYLKDGDGDGNSQPHKGVKASATLDSSISSSQVHKMANHYKMIFLLNTQKNAGYIKDIIKEVEDHLKTYSSAVMDMDIEGGCRDSSSTSKPKRFYKRSGRVGSARKPMDKSKETCFTCGKLEDEWTTKIRALCNAEMSPYVGKADARSGQWA
ncbi:hypothetical protein Tco_0658146 [Tanacetum coccineum]